MIKTVCRNSLLILLFSVRQSQLFARQNPLQSAIRQEILRFANEVQNTPPLLLEVSCSFSGNRVDEALHTSYTASAAGKWACCELVFSLLQKEKLSAEQTLRTRLALAAYYDARQQYDMAKKLAQEVSTTATETSNFKAEKAEAMLVLADAGLHTRNIDMAYRWADTALQLSRALNNLQLSGRALMQMALCSRRNFTAVARRSFLYYQEAAQVAEACGDSLTLFLSQIYTAIDYFELNDSQTALPFLRKAVSMMPHLQNLRAVYTTYVGLGYALEQNGLPGDALPLYRKALALTLQTGLPYSIQNTYTFIGGVFQKQKQYDSALVYADRVATVAGVDSFYSNSWDLKATIYRESGNYKAAADAFAKALDWEAENSLYRSRSQLSSYEVLLNTKEKELQVADEKKKSIRLQWIATGAGVLLLFALLAYLNQRHNQRKLKLQKALIEQQRNELEVSLSEKEMLLKEIHHRVKNNLMTISSLLQLQAQATQSTEAKEAIAGGQNRIRSIALLHQRLYLQTNLATVDFSAFTDDLLNDVLKVLNRPGQQVTTRNQVPETLLDIDTAVPLGLLLNELLTNSFKYAFTSGKEGLIEIALQATGKGSYQLTYADNGPGLSPGFDFRSNASLGLRLIYRLARQLSGSAAYRQEDHTFVIHFKDTATRNLEA